MAFKTDICDAMVFICRESYWCPLFGSMVFNGYLMKIALTLLWTGVFVYYYIRK